MTCGSNNNRKAVVVYLSSALRASKKEKILKLSNRVPLHGNPYRDSHMGIPTKILWEWDGNGNRNSTPTATLDISPEY